MEFSFYFVSIQFVEHGVAEVIHMDWDVRLFEGVSSRRSLHYPISDQSTDEFHSRSGKQFVAAFSQSNTNVKRKKDIAALLGHIIGRLFVVGGRRVAHIVEPKRRTNSIVASRCGEFHVIVGECGNELSR